ncbi:hypothetical protein EI94DRAFT_1803509 [Lactarius quietus]|nr:hypothetical protein EI94DRAFT_1803509 [Lactarius quietus]
METGDVEDNLHDGHKLLIPLSMNACRAPISLDFKHPVSANTVPAPGLFKALANGDRSRNANSNNTSISGELEEYRTRHAVRHRFGSREIFEQMSRTSLDDLHVLAISQQRINSRLTYCMTSGISHRLELQQYEELLEAILKPKLDDFHKTSKLLALHQDVLSCLVYLPDSVPASINAKQLADAELLARIVTEDFEKVKNIARTHSDLQVNLAKDDLLRANEQCGQLADLVSQAQTSEPEMTELWRVHDCNRALEDKYVALRHHYQLVRSRPLRRWPFALTHSTDWHLTKVASIEFSANSIRFAMQDAELNVLVQGLLPLRRSSAQVHRARH